MAKKTAPLLPVTARLLTDFGERFKLARLRRKLTAKQVAERAGMTPMTLRSLEAGGLGVTIGAYLSDMQVLGLENDVNKLAAEDERGRQAPGFPLLKNDSVAAAKPRMPRKPIADKTPLSDAATAVTDKGSDVPAGHAVKNHRASFLQRKEAGTTSADLAALLKPPNKPTKGS